MTRSEAENILLTLGWNEDGATEIIDAIDDLESMTENDLISLSEDYTDR